MLDKELYAEHEENLATTTEAQVAARIADARDAIVDRLATVEVELRNTQASEKNWKCMASGRAAELVEMKTTSDRRREALFGAQETIVNLEEERNRAVESETTLSESHDAELREARGRLIRIHRDEERLLKAQLTEATTQIEEKPL